jgi:hypothetical protein
MQRLDISLIKGHNDVLAKKTILVSKTSEIPKGKLKELRKEFPKSIGVQWYTSKATYTIKWDSYKW